MKKFEGDDANTNLHKEIQFLNNWMVTFDRISDAFISLDKNYFFTYCNKKGYQLFNAENSKILGKNIWTEYPELTGTTFYKACVEALETGEDKFVNNFSSVWKKWHEYFFYPSSDGISVFIRDISNFKTVEDEIKNVNRQYLFVSRINQMIIRTTNEYVLFKEFCKIAVDIGKFQMVWIGKFDEESKEVKPIAFSGEEKGYLSKIKITLDESRAEAHGPVASSIREGKPHICNDIENDLFMVPWRDEAYARNYQSLIAIPIWKNEKIFGSINFYSSLKLYFNKEEVTLLKEITDNISFILEKFENEFIRKTAEKSLFQSENRYRALTEMSPVGIFHSDIQGKTTYVNSKWCKITGIPFDCALGDAWMSAVHTDDKKSVFNTWNEILMYGKSSFSEFRMVHPDGGITYVIGEVIPEKDSEKNLLGFVGTITDITEIKKAEKGLMDYKFALDHSSIVDVSDKNGVILYANENFCRISGYRLNELLNQDHKIFNSGYHTKDFISGLWNTITNGQVWRNEVRNKAKDGSFFWTDTTIVPFLDESGKPIQFITIRTDITKRKATEESLIESEIKYRELVENSPDTIVIYQEGKIVFANKEIFQLLRTSNYDDLIGKSVLDFVHQNYREFVIKRMKELMATKRILPLAEEKLIRSDGSEVDVEVKAVPIIFQNKPAAQLIIRDITGKKQAEKRYIDLFNQSPQPMWLYDLQTLKFIQVNKAAEEKYGYSAEEFLKMTIMDIRPESEYQDTKKYIEKHKIEEDKKHTAKFIHKKKTGEIFEVEIFSTAIISEGKRIGSVIAIDITEKNRHQYEIMKATIKAQEDERYEIGGELHDNILQLLAASKLSLTMMEKTADPSRTVWFDRCKENISLVVEEIRHISHRLAPVFFQDKTLEEAFKKLFNDMNVGASHNVLISISDEIGNNTIEPEIQINLYRIVQEQLKNILKHSKATEIKVEIIIKDNKLLMKIADNGIGFDLNISKGGIGLANIKRRVESFSGKMKIDSSPGKGCIVAVYIPLRDKLVLSD